MPKKKPSETTTISACKGFNCQKDCPCICHKEKWNENVETCSGCGIHWKKIGHSCPVCFSPSEKHLSPTNLQREKKDYKNKEESMKKKIEISGLWLRSKLVDGVHYIEVLVEVDNKWRKVIPLNGKISYYRTDGPISEIVETIGIEKSREDDL